MIRFMHRNRHTYIHAYIHTCIQFIYIHSFLVGVEPVKPPPKYAHV